MASHTAVNHAIAKPLRPAEACGCKQLFPRLLLDSAGPGIELATCGLQVQHLSHSATEPPGRYADNLHLAADIQPCQRPAPHHSIFFRPDALSDVQPMVSKHWRQTVKIKDCKTLCKTESIVVMAVLPEHCRFADCYVWYLVHMINFEPLP